MKKLFIITLIPLMLLCGCKKEQITNTKVLRDTTYSVTADCSEEILGGAFELCEKYGNLFAPDYPDSDISMMNYYDTYEMSEDTLEVITKALYYCKKTGGKFDITLTPATNLWDFEIETIPSPDDLQRALLYVGYNKIELDGRKIILHETDIDLSRISRGFAADNTAEYLKKNGAKNGIVSFDGNALIFGRAHSFVIKKPRTNDTMFTIKLKNKAAVMSSIYQQSFEKDGVLYHHILDSSTGMPIHNTLTSVIVFGKSAAECDVLSDICMILGEKDGLNFINNTDDYEAVFIKKDNTASVSNGLKIKGKKIVYK